MTENRGPYRAHRVRRADRTALIAYLERHEPWSSAALSYLLYPTSRVERARSWLVYDARDNVVAAGVLYSPCAGRWLFYSALDDPGAGPTVAELVDRSPAIHYSGSAAHLHPVLPHVKRLFGARLATFVVAPCPAPLGGPLDPRARLAVPDELDELVGLYEHFGIGIERTRWQLRSSLRRLLRRFPLVVFENEGRIVGAGTFNGMTRRYVVSDQMVVDPACRGQGFGTLLTARICAIANGLGLAIVAVHFPTNPMSFRVDSEYAENGWVYAGLFEHKRFKGHARLRELVFRYQALEQNKNPFFAPFEALPVGAGYSPEEPNTH